MVLSGHNFTPSQGRSVFNTHTCVLGSSRGTEPIHKARFSLETEPQPWRLRSFTSASASVLDDSDCVATANQAMILLWLFVLGFELLAKWLLLSCYAANHLSLRVKCERLTHIFQLFRHLKGNLPSTAGGSSLSDIQLLDFRIPDFWGAGYRGNLLFYRTSCRRASNP